MTDISKEVIVKIQQHLKTTVKSLVDENVIYEYDLKQVSETESLLTLKLLKNDSVIIGDQQLP